MLETLRIQNYALIDELEVEFTPGLNVLTGETGAGKSIIVGALNLVLGARASTDGLREGAKQAAVEALFRIPKPSPRLTRLLKSYDVALEDGELILRRVVTAEGRSRGYVCGNLVPIGGLAELGDELVDLHGQHEHQSLLRPERQLDLLDVYANAEAQVAQVAEKVADLRGVEKELAALQSDDRERTRRAEFLRFEVGEIDAAALTPGEEEDLRGRRNLIANAERIVTLASQAYAALYENPETAAADAIDTALLAVEELAGIDAQFRALGEQLGSIRANLEEVAASIRGYTGGVEYDPAELDTVNARLTLIGNLKRKYGDSVAAILAYRERAGEELAGYEHRDERLAELDAQRKELAQDAQEKALRLSETRSAGARKLDERVSDTLQELGMKGGRFETRLELGELTAHGVDRIEFLLSANPGEPIKPLRSVASGGEISRIMLALKAVFAGADKIPTLIFDEIDAGVGGKIARKVADKLRDLAASHQTICITHLPQIAASARSHYRVDKASKKGRAQTTVAHVTGDTRVEELARLLDGSVSDVSLEHARALLQEAGG